MTPANASSVRTAVTMASMATMSAANFPRNIPRSVVKTTGAPPTSSAAYQIQLA